MRTFALIVAVTMSSLVGIGSASAMSAPGVGNALDSSIIQVAGGCGPGGHRDYYGRCVPNGRPIYRGCPYGFHRAPNGRCYPNR